MKKGDEDVLALAALAYLLLSVPITLRLLVCINGGVCWSEASAFALGMGARVDARVLWRGHLRILPRYGQAWEPDGSGEAAALPPAVLRRLARMGRWELCALAGLGDAAQTATAVGALRAGLCALMAGLRMAGSVRVGADFRAQRFLLTARCIIRAPLGDIIFSAARAAMQERRRSARLKARKEGFAWSSIPSRA